MTHDARCKRRRRGKRAGSSPAPEIAVLDSGPASEAPWQWRTFPVGFAFVLGALVMGMLTWIATGAFYIFLVTAVFLSVFGIAHYFGRTFREYRSSDVDADED
jgi:hypothetical protein